MNVDQSSKKSVPRRQVLKLGGLAAGSALTPYFWSSARAQEQSKNDRPIAGAIGMGGRAGGINRQAREFCDFAAVCDVDRNRAQGALGLTGGKGKAYTDYRELLERPDIDAVTIATPDHWHAKIAIEAMRAGKDVYCEKPLTLTIDEGKQICRVVKATGRVLQVGTQQRSEWGLYFLKALALIRNGRLGKIHRVTLPMHVAPTGGPFNTSPPPAHLDWERWLGQAPLVEYTPKRCHGKFRWWYEYAGGQLTDWGAHDIDIAHWGLGMDDTGPTTIDAKGTLPNIPNGYNTASDYHITCACPGDVELIIHSTDDGESVGVMFEGDKGRIFVNRAGVRGKPVEQLADDPLPEDALVKVYGGRQPGNHMRNFFECARDRVQPISDVFSHHRAVTTCHLANISLRLGRKLQWDPVKEQIVGDEEANRWLSRTPRAGYEIEA